MMPKLHTLKINEVMSFGNEVSNQRRFSNGKTVVTHAADIHVNEPAHAVVALPATATVEQLVKALNLLGASTRDLIAVLQAMKAAGALDADIEVF